MIVHDQQLGSLLDAHTWTEIAFPTMSLGIVLAADVFFRVRDRKPAHLP